MTADSPKKSLIGRLFRLALILIVILAVLAALAPTLFSGFVKDKIVESMEEKLDANVTIEDFSFGWFSGAEVGGFELTRPGASEPALSVGHLSSNPSLSEVFNGKFIVEDIVAKDVTVRVARTEKGIDWQDIGKSSSSKSKSDSNSNSKSSSKSSDSKTEELPEFLVRAEVQNLRVIYKDLKLDEAIDLGGMKVNVTADRSDNCTFKMTGPHGISADMAIQLFEDKKLLDTDAMTANGTINIARLNLGDFAPHLAQFVADLGGTLKSTQNVSYGPNGKIEVKGDTSWNGLVAKAAMAGVSSKTGTCASTFLLNKKGEQIVLASLRMLQSEVVGLPKQKEAVPCGKGGLDIELASNQLLTLKNGMFDIPGGRLTLSGTHGMGEVQGKGIVLDGNTDLALWSKYFEEIPDLQGKVKVNGVVPPDMTKKPVILDVDIAGLRLTGGPLEDKSYNCGNTTADMKITMPVNPDGPRKFDINTKSRMWDIKMTSSLATVESAAFGMLGNAGIQGNCDLEQLLAPFTDSRGQGRVTFDFLAALKQDELGISNAKVSGPATKGKLSANIGRQGDAWRFDVNGDQFTYQRGDGIGLLMPKLIGNGNWDKASGRLQGQLNLANVRTLGGTGPTVQGGNVAVKFNGTANQELGRYKINFTQMDLAGFSGTGNVDYGTKTGLKAVTIQGEADYAELSSRWLRLYDPAAEGSGKGPILLTMTPNGTDWKAAEGRAEMAVPFLKYKGLSFSDLVVKGNMSEGKGRITEGQGKVNEGTVKLSGDIDMSGDDTVFKGEADMKKVKIVEEWQPAIARLIPLFAGIGVKAEGLVDIKLKADGTGNNWESIKPSLNGDGVVGLTEGSIASSPILETLGLALGFNPNMGIDDITSAFQVKDGGVHQDGLIAKLGGIELKMAGTTYLDGRMDYDLGFKPTSTSPTNWERYAALVATDGYLPLKLQGTLDSPEPGLPDVGKLLESGAKKLLGDTLGNLIGGENKDGKNDSKNPLGGLLEGLGGGKKKEDPKKKDDAKKEKPKSPLGGLGGLLGGGKDN